MTLPLTGTHCKQYKGIEFDHKAFWEWVKFRPFDVFVSERIVPDDAEVLLKKEMPNRANTKGIDGFKTSILLGFEALFQANSLL